MFQKIVLIVAIGTCMGDDFFSEEKHSKGWIKCLNPQLEYSADLFYNDHIEELFFVMANKLFVISLTKALTGKPPTSRDFIQDACFKELELEASIKPRITGYKGKMVEYDCKGNVLGQRTCTATNASSNQQWASNWGTRDDTFVWRLRKDAVNPEYVMGVSCVGEMATWNLRSTRNAQVPENVKKLVLEQITKMGFKAEDAVDIPRGGCTN